MLNEESRRRLAQLQQRELDGELDDAESNELDVLVEIVARDENLALKTTTARLRIDNEQGQAQNDALRSILRRQSRLMQRLERVIVLSKVERAAIESDLQRVLALTGRD